MPKNFHRHRSPNGHHRPMHARRPAGENSPFDLVWHAPFNTEQIHTRSHNFKTNCWDPLETSTFSVYVPQDFNFCEACCMSILPIFSCTYFCCDDNTRTFNPWFNIALYKDNYSDLISKENFQKKLETIWQKAIEYNSKTGYAMKRNCGQTFYCCIGDWFEKYDERGYGPYVNWRKQELDKELREIVSQQSDSSLEFSLQWQASYPDINLTRKDEVDQLKEISAWSGLTELPTGHLISIKDDDGNSHSLPIEGYAYDLQVVIKRRKPKPNFVTPPIKLDPSDMWLSCVPGFEILPSQWRQVQQSDGRLWQTIWKADVEGPRQPPLPLPTTTGVKNGLLNASGQPYILVPQGQQTDYYMCFSTR